MADFNDSPTASLIQVDPALVLPPIPPMLVLGRSSVSARGVAAVRGGGVLCVRWNGRWRDADGVTHGWRDGVPVERYCAVGVLAYERAWCWRQQLQRS